MKQLGLRSVRRKKYRLTTDSDHDFKISPNLLKRDFKIGEINKVWVSDITSIWTSRGWVNLVVFMDLGSRNIVSWKLSKSMSKRFLIDALKQAIRERNPGSGLIIHSDRGSQYCSNEFRSIIKDNQYRQSMSRKGDCWDNAVAESFFNSLKVELIKRNNYKNIGEVEMDLFNYIEVFYKRNRLHSSINYLTPMEYESSFLS